MSHFYAILGPKSSDQAQKDFTVQKAAFAVFLSHFQTHQRGVWRLPSLTQPSTQDSVSLFASTLFNSCTWWAEYQHIHLPEQNSNY